MKLFIDGVKRWETWLFIPLLSLIFYIGLSASDSKVFICTGPKSECYHKTRSCRGLKSCSKEIKEVTLAEAKRMNRRPCGFCYK